MDQPEAVQPEDQEPEPLRSRQQYRAQIRDLELRLDMTAREAAGWREKAERNRQVAEKLREVGKQILAGIMETAKAIWPSLTADAAKRVAELYQRAAPKGSPLPGPMPGLALVEGGRVRG